MDAIITLRGDLSDDALVLFAILRRLAGRTKTQTIAPRSEILEARGRPNDDIGAAWIDAALAELEKANLVTYAETIWTLKVPALDPGLRRYIATPKPSVAERREPFLPAAKGIVGLYSAKIKSRQNGDTSRQQAIQNVAQLLLNAVSRDGLYAAVQNYGEHCRHMEVEVQFRKNAGNFFGRDGVWRDFVPSAYVASTPESEVRDPRRKALVYDGR